MKTYFKKKIAYLGIFALLFPIFYNILFFQTSYALVSGQIDNTSQSYVSSTGSLSLSNLQVGGVYEIMSGSTLVSSGSLTATNSTGSLELNPSFFTNYGLYSLTLSGNDISTSNSNLDSESLFIGPIDYQDLYVNQIAPALTGSGINTNLGSVTYANVMSFTGLFFETLGMGKILFDNALDLTNSGTVGFLETLPNQLNMSSGRIEFDPTNSDFANFGAQLSMYFSTGSTFIPSITQGSSFVIKSNTGQVIDSSGVLSNIQGSCGISDCMVVFDTAHFTSFDLKPLLTQVHITSNNTYSGSFAAAGDQVFLSFTGSETLTGISVTFSGVAAQSITGTGNTWTATSQPIGSGNGTLAFSIDYEDATGNTGATQTGTTDSSVVSLDTAGPNITSKQIQNITETGAILHFTFSEDHFVNQSGSLDVTDNNLFNGTFPLTFSGNTGSSSITGLTGNVNYVFTLSLIDDLGNSESATGSFSTANLVTGTGNITETGSVSFGFTGDLAQGNTFDLSGTHLVINSDPNDSSFLTGSLSLSGITIVTSSGSWNGILLPPTLVDPNSAGAATTNEVGNGLSIIQTVQVGSENGSLSASGGFFEVSFVVPGYNSGTVLSILRSSNGSTWEANTPDATCTLDTNSLCSFRTDHLSFFAIGLDSEPDTFSFTSVNNAELTTVVESNTITITGTDTGSTISIVGGEYKIGTGSYTSVSGMVNTGETVTVRLTSSSSFSTLTTATVSIGGVSASFNVTTKAAPSGGGGGGGGGGGSIMKDICPNGDTSPSYYDKKCGPQGTINNSPDIGISKYISKNAKVNRFELKIDRLIQKYHKENNLIVLQLRDDLIMEVEKYVVAIQTGNKAELTNIKRNLLLISKNLFDELKKKLYDVKYMQLTKFSRALDRHIIKKTSPKNTDVWQYRNEILELLDYYIENKSRLTLQERRNVRNEVLNIYVKILGEVTK